MTDLSMLPVAMEGSRDWAKAGEARTLARTDRDLTVHDLDPAPWMVRQQASPERNEIAAPARQIAYRGRIFTVAGHNRPGIAGASRCWNRREEGDRHGEGQRDRGQHHRSPLCSIDGHGDPTLQRETDFRFIRSDERRPSQRNSERFTSN